MSAGNPAELRVCVPTSRRFVKSAFKGAAYEAQDVLASSTGADLVELEPAPGYELRERWLRRLVWKDVTGRLVRMNPGLRPVRLMSDYDVLAFYCMEFKDLLHINAITNWRKRCATAICVLDEIWISDVAESKHFLEALRPFDHVFIGMDATVDVLSEALGRPCHFFPPAADALRFSPLTRPVQRVLDIYSLGRRRDSVHRHLLEYASREGKFYVYDTLGGGDSLAKDHRVHRNGIAEMAKRSHCFMVAAAKADMPEETHGQIEIPNRYYEGAMTGAILVGDRLDCRTFHRFFNWADSVVEVRPDGSDAVAVVSALLADPDRMHTIGSQNALEALRRHDWVYRWLDAFRIVGVAPTPGMLARSRELNALANAATPRTTAPDPARAGGTPHAAQR
jgi:hypothetical protein